MQYILPKKKKVKVIFRATICQHCQPKNNEVEVVKLEQLD